MGVSNPNKPKSAEKKGKALNTASPEQKRPVSRRKSAERTAERKYEAVVDGKSTKLSESEVKRGELMAEFLPENLTYLKDVLGIDLTDEKKYDKDFIDDLVHGRVTKPIEMTVTPLAYDRELKKKNVEMPKISIISSVRMGIPHDSEYKQLPINPKVKETALRVETYPHYLKCEKVDGEEEMSEAISAGTADMKQTADKIEFTPEEKMALEGIGINDQRLYGGKFNSFDMETKKQIKDGEDFVFAGSVNTEVGYLSVSGIGRLSNEDGKVVATFEPLDKQEGKDLVLDITNVRKIGNLELDFFERGTDGKIMRDESGQPRLNAAGWNLVEYGQAMEPVTGYVHLKSEWSKEKNRYIDEVKKWSYQVSVVNGGLVVTPMKEVVKDERYEVYAAIKDDKVKINGEYLEFVSEREKDMYIRGYGGIVKGATWKDYKTGKDVKYEAFVVADNKKNGYGFAYSPSVSKALIERRAENMRKEQAKEEQKARRAALLKPKKQGFSIKH